MCPVCIYFWGLFKVISFVLDFMLQEDAIQHNWSHILVIECTAREITAKSNIVLSSRIHSPWLGDKVDSVIGLSYRPARQHRLTGRYDKSTTLCRSQLYIPVRDYEFCYCTHVSINLNSSFQKCKQNSSVHHLLLWLQNDTNTFLLLCCLF